MRWASKYRMTLNKELHDTPAFESQAVIERLSLKQIFWKFQEEIQRCLKSR